MSSLSFLLPVLYILFSSYKLWIIRFKTLRTLVCSDYVGPDTYHYTDLHSSVSDTDTIWTNSNTDVLILHMFQSHIRLMFPCYVKNYLLYWIMHTYEFQGLLLTLLKGYFHHRRIQHTHKWPNTSFRIFTHAFWDIVHLVIEHFFYTTSYYIILYTSLLM